MLFLKECQKSYIDQLPEIIYWKEFQKCYTDPSFSNISLTGESEMLYWTECKKCYTNRSVRYAILTVLSEILFWPVYQIF